MQNEASASHANAAHAIANYLADQIADKDEWTRCSYKHMGATLTDTVLQAGLNYRTVVLPRVERLLLNYPEADTTTKFSALLNQLGPNSLLRWNHHEKIDRLKLLIDLLKSKTIETEPELAQWLAAEPTASSELLTLKGIGPKTVDYLKILIGIPTIAVDRHVRTLFETLGLPWTAYQDLQSIVCHAADILNVRAHVLDGMIWKCATRGKSQESFS